MLHLAEQLERVRSTVVAAEAIEENVCSPPFYFDIVYLFQQFQVNKEKLSTTTTTNTAANKKVKVIMVNGQLEETCAAERGRSVDWMRYTCPAMNCHQQNVTMTLALKTLDGDLSNHLHPGGSSFTASVVFRTTRKIWPKEELFFWPSVSLLLSMNIPFLSPANIVSGNCYACTECGQVYSQPNPLKLHLRFECPFKHQPDAMVLPDFSPSSTIPLPELSSSSNSSMSSLVEMSRLALPGSTITTTTAAAAAVIEENLASLRLNMNRTFKPTIKADESLLHDNDDSNSGEREPRGHHHRREYHHHHHHHHLANANGHSHRAQLRKLHPCIYCGKVYTRKYGLKIHIRTHTGVKPLSCRFCGRSFSDPSNLNKHVRLHVQQQLQPTSPVATANAAGVGKNKEHERLALCNFS